MPQAAVNRRPSARSQAKEMRRKMIAKINIIWKELRPDLSTADELREARLDFARAELNLPSLGSFTELTDGQLRRVLEVLVREQSGAVLPGMERTKQAAPPPSAPGGAEVFHLASKEQCWAINAILNYLKWSSDAREGFLVKNFRRRSAQMLSPKSAHSCIRILLNIAASRDLKAAKGDAEAKVSKVEIDSYLPELKRRIGIGK